MTGTLTIRYRKPTPLRTHLRIEARCLGRDGRKVQTWGGIFNGDVMTAEAEGTFIVVGPKRMVAMVEANPDSADPVMLAAIRAEAAAVAANMQGSYAREGEQPGADDDPGTAGPLQVAATRTGPESRPVRSSPGPPSRGPGACACRACRWDRGAWRR